MMCPTGVIFLFNIEMNEDKSIYPTMRHPNRYVWDFWYYFDPEAQAYHVFYLNADPERVPQGKHHLSSQVGYGVTTDFLRMDWGSCDVLTADPDRWDNTSIWSGDIIRIKDGFLLFYTSRSSEEDDGNTQNIGIAFADRIDTNQWEPLPGIRIRPDPSIYEPRHVPGDISTHAWRDPFLFRQCEQAYMLITAKSVKRPAGRNGVVGLLRSSDGGLSNWDYLEPMSNPGCYSEMEVPQIYKNVNDAYELVYSSPERFDLAPTTDAQGGLHGITSPDFEGFSIQHPHIHMPEKSGLYACRIIPEMGGEIAGFDTRTGGIRRSGVKTGFRHVDRDFTMCSIN